MKEPYHTRLRQARRSAGLTQDDVARILGVGGRSYVAMLESDDRIPHVRDIVLLGMLFDSKEADLFPHLFAASRLAFRKNASAAIDALVGEGEDINSDRARFVRHALTAVELDENIAPPDA